MARLFYYNVCIESGVEEDVKAFGTTVAHVLTLSGGWNRWGFSFVPVYPDKTGARHMRQRMKQYMTIQLCSNATIAQFGPDFEGMSVADCSHNFIRINVDRWHTGPKPAGSTMSLSDYRQYVILHEVGHVLSQCSPTHHQTACAPDGRAPIMMQQTNGVGNCEWNPWPVEGVDDREVQHW